MMVELKLDGDPDLELDGFQSADFQSGTLFASRENRVEVIVKEHPDGTVSVFTDDMDVVEQVSQAGQVVDLHPA